MEIIEDLDKISFYGDVLRKSFLNWAYERM